MFNIWISFSLLSQSSFHESTEDFGRGLVSSWSLLENVLNFISQIFVSSLESADRSIFTNI